ncbi:hypothetical protein GGX14DRAFT_663200 [Mycena pura]|uniref:AVL9/DENND6 domain-containing protein n=1 Tax=Mycena pura TaxID=153505 RepID=A0AAD6YKS0_9AGAR|nr:hypothetical protein GGX14DRAFT_663200 [Mycena pura]
MVLVKALILQKRVRYCFSTYNLLRIPSRAPLHSLVSLLPGLMQTLDDCGSPPLAERAPTLSRPTELRTSDRKKHDGQLNVAAGCKSWLCGNTNSTVTQRKEIDLFVNTETGVLEFRDPEFRDPKLERLIALTPADRKWISSRTSTTAGATRKADQFKGSDDYLRTKFEEYISAALASVRYRDFVAKGQGNSVIISGGTGNDANSMDDFNALWIAEFKNTKAYEVWDRTTDPMLFDIVEPRHPCNEKPSVVADIGLRLQEGLQDLKLEQQLAPAHVRYWAFVAGAVVCAESYGLVELLNISAPVVTVTIDGSVGIGCSMVRAEARKVLNKAEIRSLRRVEFMPSDSDHPDSFTFLDPDDVVRSVRPSSYG